MIISHPEIQTVPHDQKVMDPAVAKYLQTLATKYPKVHQGLKTFRNTVTGKTVPQLSEIDWQTQPLWTYTERQHQQALGQLQRIVSNYPIPQTLQGKTKTGNYLDLRDQKNTGEFYTSLDTFNAQIENLPSPTPYPIAIEKIGQLPLQTLHTQEGNDWHDLIIGEKLHTIWTLDVSFNLGLSIKDLMAKAMVEKALERKELTKNQCIIEGTSGNTGVGLALMGLHSGIKTILIIPDKMSQGKIDRLKLLGAHVIVTPTKVDADSPLSYYSVRDYLIKRTHGWGAQQYDNLVNREAHEAVTGPIIWEKTQGKITAVVGTIGTGGTLSGIARYLKKKNPKIKVLAVDPMGSILYLLHQGYSIEEVQKYAQSYTVQGFGEDIYPKNLDLKNIDHILRVSDASSMNMAQAVPALGFWGGQSCGAAYAGVLQALEQKLLTHQDKVLVLFPDTGIAYRQDVFNDTWMKEKGFYEII